MSNIIEDFYYGNIEPQEVNSELTPKLKKKLSSLADKEEQLTARLTGEDKELFQNYVSAYIEFSTTSNADSFISGSVQDLHMTHLLRTRKDNAIVKNITLATLTIKFVPQAGACGIASYLRILNLPITGNSFAFPPSALTIPIIARTVIASAASGEIIQPIMGIAAITEESIAPMKSTSPWLV